MSTKSDDALKHELYVVLFSTGKRMLLEELATVVKEKDLERVRKLLVLVKEDLEQGAHPITLIQEGDEYKLSVRSKFMDLVQKVVKQTEVPKSILETLAVVAYKTPVLQSEVIKIRTNKAYDHLSALEELGYITREKHGRTRMIKVTQKFYDYFEISPEELQKKIEEKKAIQETEALGKITVYGEPIPQKNEEVKVYSEKEEGKTETPEKVEVDTPIDTGETLFLETKEDIKTEEKGKVKEEGKTEEEDKDQNEDKEEDEKEQYKPPKVKGGFDEFSKEEREKIKETLDDITKEEEQ